jgi:ABC-type transport system substrate-binding protein
MKKTTLTRRAVLRTGALATTALAMPFVRSSGAAGTVVPKGKMVLAWHTNITARWLDPQQHDGTASPDNFLMALHDALIKNFREVRYDHPALAESYDFAEDAKSATFHLRPGLKFHDGTPVTPDDVKWSYEHYHGAWGEVLHERTQGIEIVDGGTVRFHFNQPFLDFPILLGLAMSVAPVGPSPPNIMKRSDRRGFYKSRSAPDPTSLSRRSPACASSSRLLTITTARFT